MRLMQTPLTMLIVPSAGYTQVPLEIVTGQNFLVFDVTWMRPIQNDRGNRESPFSYFNRNRSSVDYHNKVLFSSINVLSLHLKKGLGLVAAGEFTANGFSPQMGIQFFKGNKSASIFTFLLCETSHKPLVEWFTMGRYEYNVTENLHLYLRFESLNIRFNSGNYTHIQRLRTGLRRIGRHCVFDSLNIYLSDDKYKRHMELFTKHLSNDDTIGLVAEHATAGTRQSSFNIIFLILNATDVSLSTIIIRVFFILKIPDWDCRRSQSRRNISLNS